MGYQDIKGYQNITGTSGGNGQGEARGDEKGDGEIAEGFDDACADIVSYGV
jgi:hypothetical protein